MAKKDFDYTTDEEYYTELEAKNREIFRNTIEKLRKNTEFFQFKLDADESYVNEDELNQYYSQIFKHVDDLAEYDFQHHLYSAEGKYANHYKEAMTSFIQNNKHLIGKNILIPLDNLGWYITCSEEEFFSACNVGNIAFATGEVAGFSIYRDGTRCIVLTNYGEFYFDNFEAY